jgi:hypothetical protein
MSEPLGRPRPLDTALQRVRHKAAGFLDRIAGHDGFGPANERNQEIRRHMAAGLFVLLLVAVGLSLLMSL